MTNTEAFQRVWTHFIAERRPQALEAGRCCYRTKKGDKCAAGCLIPAELYDDALEGTPIAGCVRASLSLLDFFSGMDINLLEDMQDAHDIARQHTFRADIEIALRKIGALYCLPIPGEA